MWFAGGQKVAIKIFSNLDENLDIIEEEFRIFKDLSRHDNFPTFYGAFFNKYDKDFKNELWLVMEVRDCFSLFLSIKVMSKLQRSKL
jgi:serine/threonine protein kinase